MLLQVKTNAKLNVKATKKGHTTPALFHKLALETLPAAHIMTVENEYQKVARIANRNILFSIDFLLKE
jgi:hypothetical protein